MPNFVRDPPTSGYYSRDEEVLGEIRAILTDDYCQLELVESLKSSAVDHLQRR